MKQPKGEKEVSKLSDKIYSGALTFLNSEYKPLTAFVAVLALILYLTEIPDGAALAFMGGAFCSALAGNVGMRIATKSNSRATVGAEEEIRKTLIKKGPPYGSIKYGVHEIIDINPNTKVYYTDELELAKFFEKHVKFDLNEDLDKGKKQALTAYLRERVPEKAFKHLYSFYTKEKSG